MLLLRRIWFRLFGSKREYGRVYGSTTVTHFRAPKIEECCPGCGGEVFLPSDAAEDGDLDTRECRRCHRRTDSYECMKAAERCKCMAAVHEPSCPKAVKA